MRTLGLACLFLFQSVAVFAYHDCHADSSACTCCGVESPVDTVMTLVGHIAGDGYGEESELAQRVRTELSSLFDEVGVEHCPTCTVRRTVMGILDEDDTCCQASAREPIEESVFLTSDEGRSILRESHYQRDLLPLLQHFEVQHEGWWCAVATSTMVLNALPIPRAESKYAHYRLFTQERFFDDPTAKELGLAPDNKSGISLGQLHEVLNNKPEVCSELHEMRSADPTYFRQRVKEVLKNPAAYIMVNYSRNEADQGQGAHFSPVAAYHEGADAVLILDTAKFKYAPFWMPVELACRAMNTPDSKNAEIFRGWLVVSALTQEGQ